MYCLSIRFREESGRLRLLPAVSGSVDLWGLLLERHSPHTVETASFLGKSPKNTCFAAVAASLDGEGRAAWLGRTGNAYIRGVYSKGMAFVWAGWSPGL